MLKGEDMKSLKILTGLGLVMMAGHAGAQWGNWGMPGSSHGNSLMFPGTPYSQPQYNPAPRQPFAGMMPYPGQQTPRYQTPPPTPQPFAGMMPYPGQQVPQYQAPAAQPFGGMMPFGQQQPRYQPPVQQPFAMPGMEQGIRSMMQPGKIMAEEATPGMYVKPTWR